MNTISTAPGVPPEAENTKTKHPFLVTLGQRVRHRRTQQKFPRKALAKAADISERHLANLEYGIGNPSILVLLSVAEALGCTINELLGDGHSPAARPIALVGLRGAGKSTLGALLADELGVPLIEISRLIEQRAGGSTGDILALSGAEGYQRHTRRALQAAIDQNPKAVLATPGGIADDEDNYEWLLRHCITVWLSARPEDHMNRVIAQGDLRPMAASAEAMADLQAILARRSATYSRAHTQINTSEGDVASTFSALREKIAALA